MLQHTESTETSPTGASSLAPVPSETLSAEAETKALDLDAELAELTACMTAGVARGARRGKTFVRRYLLFTAGFIALDIAWMIGLLHGLLVPNTIPKLLLMCVPILSIPVVLISSLLWLYKDHTTEQERDAAKRIVEVDDIRAVGPLIDTIGLVRGKLRPPLWQALGRLLPRMTEDEAQALGKERHFILANWIQGWDISLNRKVFAGAGDDVLLRILQVMAQVGQSSFQTQKSPMPVTAPLRPTLKKWADGKGAGQNPVVQQAAIACDEAIKQKMILARRGAQLLRASSPTPAGSDTLLRPTEGTQETDPTELLRPGDPNS